MLSNIIMIDEYLENISFDLKKKILNKIENDLEFYNFIVNCIKVDLNIFINNKIINNNILIDSINSKKSYEIKKNTLKILKLCNLNLDNASQIINKYYNNLNNIILILDKIKYYILNNINLDIFHINYYTDNLNIIEVNNNIFICSDELYSENNDIKYKKKLNNKSKFIEEFSNN